LQTTDLQYHAFLTPSSHENSFYLSYLEPFMRSMTALLLVLTATAGCGGSAETRPQQAAKSGSARIVVTSQPLLEMATTVGSDVFAVSKIVPATMVSRQWKPTKEDAQSMRHADAILINGAGYEPWMDRVSLPGSRVKDTAAGYYEQLIRIPDAVTHQHGPAGKHGHAGTVWATWLDPNLAISQLSQVTAALIRIAPEHQQTLETESTKFRAKLESLNGVIEELKTSTHAAKFTVLADGPSYHYLTERLGWKLNYLHWDDSGKWTEPDGVELTERLKTMPADGRRLFLLSTHHADQAADFAAAAGLTVVWIDLCEYPDSANATFPERLEGNLTRLKAALAGQ